MTKRRKPADPGLLPEPVMRRLLDATSEFQRLRPWATMWDSIFVGCRDERTRELRICSVLGAAGEVFGMVSYRGTEGLGLVYALATQEHEPPREQFLSGMNCLKLDFALKRELTQADLARLTAVGFTPEGQGHVWPVFQSMRPSWALRPATEEEAIQLTDDLMKVSRFARWYAQSKAIYESHARTEIPVVGLGEHPLAKEEIDWTPFLPPMAVAEDALSLTDEQADQLLSLPMAAGGVAEVEATFLHAATFLDSTGRRRIPRAVIMCDRASGIVHGVEMFSGDDPLRDGVGKIVLGGMTKHRMRPERIVVRDPTLLRLLGPACARIGVELERVDKLVTAADALESLASYLRGNPRE